MRISRLKIINSKELSTGDNYKLLSGLLVPRAVAWVSTLNQDGNSINLAPFSFFSSVPSSRPLISLGIGNKQASVPKDTVRNIRREKEAVVHLPQEPDLEVLNATAATIPYGQSEAQSNGIQLVDSTLIQTPAIKNTKVRLETKLYKEVPITGLDGKQDASILLMEVVRYVVDERIVDGGLHTDFAELEPIIRLSGPNYGKINEIYQLDRPDHDSQPS